MSATETNVLADCIQSQLKQSMKVRRSQGQVDMKKVVEQALANFIETKDAEKNKHNQDLISGTTDITSI